MKTKTVYIIGGGPSLMASLQVPQEVQAKVRETNNLTLLAPYMEPLKDKNVIAVNMAYVLAPWLKTIFFGDEGFWKNNKENLLAHSAENVSSNSCFKAGISDITYFPKDKLKKLGLSENQNTLCWNNNSGAAAIDYAAHQGATTIILLGFDMVNVEGESHWHNEYQSPPSMPYAKHKKGFPKIKEDADKLGIEIINCSPVSTIKEFPVKPLSEILTLPAHISPVHGRTGKKSGQYVIATITPSNSPERALFIEFCKNRLNKQTRKANFSLFIDYHNVPGKIDLVERYQQGIKEAFEKGADLVVFIEDDDFYPVTYLQEMEENWINAGCPSIIGCNTTRYYHLLSLGYSVMTPQHHSSAHCTAIAKGAKYMVGEVGNAFYDVYLWKANPGGALVNFINPPISIKHHIGVCGGRGHNDRDYKAYDSQKMEWVEQFLDPEAFAFYNMMRQSLLETTPPPLSKGEWVSLFKDRITPCKPGNILQGFVSTNSGGEEPYLSKYALRVYEDNKQPLVMFGCFNQKDFQIVTRHRSILVVHWVGKAFEKIQGRDLPYLQRPNIIHTSFDTEIIETLNGMGILCILLPTDFQGFNMDELRKKM